MYLFNVYNGTIRSTVRNILFCVFMQTNKNKGEEEKGDTTANCVYQLIQLC